MVPVTQFLQYICRCNEMGRADAHALLLLTTAAIMWSDKNVTSDRVKHRTLIFVRCRWGELTCGKVAKAPEDLISLVL